MQYPRKYQAKKVMKFLVLKVEAQIPRCLEVKVFMAHLFMIPVTTLIM